MGRTFASRRRVCIERPSVGRQRGAAEIISVFLGEQLNDIFEQVTRGGAKSSKGGETLKVGVDSLPIIPKDAGDRNRTSPFAFTGNRFEFRAVGSGQSIAGPMIAMNTIVAESLDYIATKLERAVGGDPSKLNAAVQKVLEEIMAENGSVVFNGDGYSDSWHKEAGRRGLLNLRSCVEAIPLLGTKEATELFSKYGVLTERELHSRMDVYLEQYCLAVLLEARTVIEMAKTIIFPAAIRYQGELALTCANLKAVGYVFDTDTLDRVTALVKDLQDGIVKLEGMLAEHGGQSKLEHAKHLRSAVLPAMAAVRKTADLMEGIVADDLWPLATYQEMLFIV